MTSKAVDLGHSVYQVDIFDQKQAGITSCYIVAAEKAALIETGASPGAPHILEALSELGVPREKVGFIIGTHIHLDHTGGAGVLLRELKNAVVYVHPRGARHLIDPSRLAAGAKTLYGDQFDELFGEIAPVPEDKVKTPEDGESIDLGGRVLTFYHSPGHARHHMVIYDPVSGGLFAGDAVGVRFERLSRICGREITMPTTPPSEFDPPAMVESLERFKTLNLKRVYFTHFGMSEDVNAIIDRHAKIVRRYEELGQEFFVNGKGTVAGLEERIWEMVMADLRPAGITDKSSPDLEYVALNVKLNALGIQNYCERLKKS